MHKPIGIILSGGQATRMNGQDKGLITFRGKSLAALVIERLDSQVSKIFISANRNINEYKKLGVSVIPDNHPDFQGPLAGIFSVLSVICSDNPGKEQSVIIVPCDAPLLPLDLVQRFQTKSVPHENTPGECKLAHDGKQLQPLFAMLATSFAGDINKYLQSGQRSVKGWCENHNPAIIDFSDTPLSFKNINTPSDLQWLDNHLT